MNTKTKTIVLLSMGMFFLIGNQTAEAQLLKKLKDAAQGKTPPPSEQKKGTKLKGEDLIDKTFTEDQYGISGIYYYQNTSGIFPAKFDLSISDEKSTDKGAEDMPAFARLKYSIAYEERGNTKVNEDDRLSYYVHAYNLMTYKELYFESGGFAPIFQLAPGVFLKVPGNTSTSFSGSDASVNRYNDEDWKYLAEYGTIYVKEKADLSKWSSPDIDLIKTKVMDHVNKVQETYAMVNAKKNSKTEMPSVGKLNSKFIQDRALKTYKEKNDPINKGWTHHYMYVHGNEWVNKKKYNAVGVLVDTHRELQVVIVRTSPQGECRADLMYYNELYVNGKYDAANGLVSGPVSYIGMPGGVLPCEKATAFKSKLAK